MVRINRLINQSAPTLLFFPVFFRVLLFAPLPPVRSFPCVEMYLPVPPSDPNKTFVLASCNVVKSDVSGMAVGADFLVRYAIVRNIQHKLSFVLAAASAKNFGTKKRADE